MGNESTFPRLIQPHIGMLYVDLKRLVVRKAWPNSSMLDQCVPLQAQSRDLVVAIIA